MQPRTPVQSRRSCELIRSRSPKPTVGLAFRPRSVELAGGLEHIHLRSMERARGRDIDRESSGLRSVKRARRREPSHLGSLERPRGRDVDRDLSGLRSVKRARGRDVDREPSDRRNVKCARRRNPRNLRSVERDRGFDYMSSSQRSVELARKVDCDRMSSSPRSVDSARGYNINRESSRLRSVECAQGYDVNRESRHSMERRHGCNVNRESSRLRIVECAQGYDVNRESRRSMERGKECNVNHESSRLRSVECARGYNINRESSRLRSVERARGYDINRESRRSVERGQESNVNREFRRSMERGKEFNINRDFSRLRSMECAQGYDVNRESRRSMERGQECNVNHESSGMRSVERAQGYDVNRESSCLLGLNNTKYNSHLHWSVQALTDRTDTFDKLTLMHNAVPEFDPARKEQTMAMWLHKVNESATIYNWSEKHIIDHALPKLRGIAQRWYEGLSSALFSWVEWQEKLLATFPSGENYGQTLSDMLEKRAKCGDSLEKYFYDKITLLNRCGITGKRAVECILHGVDDRSVRLAAEAAQYEDPNNLLAYLRSINNADQRIMEPGTSNVRKSVRKLKIIRCFNCSQGGHTASNCSQPIKHCSRCFRIGHETSRCISKRPLNKKSVIEIPHTQNNIKFLKQIIVNGIEMEAFIDLDSEHSIIRFSEFKRLNSSFETNALPILQGFGNAVVRAIGRQIVQVVIDGAEANVELIIVPDDVIQESIILGQSFTENIT